MCGDFGLNRAVSLMTLLLETLEDNDDVQNVWHNWDMPETDEE